MTLKIGSLQTDITADTSGLEQAAKKSQQLFEKIESASKSSDAERIASSEKVNKSLGEQNKQLRKVNHGLGENDNQQRKANQGTRQHSDSSDELTKRLKDQDKQQGMVNRGLGQLGIQVGQFAGQIQGGANALLAFSQQSSDVLIVLGQMFPRLAAFGGIAGAVIAIGSAVGMGLLPFLQKAKPSTERLTKALEDLGKVAKTVGKDELVILTEEIAKLAQESEDAARTVVRGGIVDAMAVIEESAKQTKSSVTDLLDDFLLLEKPTGRGLTTYNNKLKELQKRFNLSADESRELAGALRQVGELGDSESLQRLQRVLDSIAQSGNNKAFVSLANQVREFSNNADDANKKLVALQSIARDISGAAEKSKIVGTGELDSRIEEIERLGETEREVIEREYKERETLILAQTKLTEDKRNELLQKAADERLTQLQEISARELEAEKRKQEKVQDQIDKIKQLDESERDRVMREFYERKDWIQAQTQLNEDELTSLIVAARNHRNAELEKINDREVQNEIQKQQKIQQAFREQLSAMQSMGSGLTQAMAAANEEGAAKIAGIISGVAQTTSAIVSLMQAQATAQAIADPSAPSLPQKLANVATVASVFASIVGTIASIKKGAGRQHGGLTSGNMMHPVNERGVPELLNVGNKQYIMPTGRTGRVTPLEKASSGSSKGLNVQVINNAAGVQVTAEQVTRDDLKIYVEAEINKISASAATGRGDFAAKLQQGFDVKRRLR